MDGGVRNAEIRVRTLYIQNQRRVSKKRPVFFLA